MGEFAIRAATEADIPAIVDNHERVAAEGRWIASEAPVDREKALAWRRESIAAEDTLMLVAESEGAIIGELGLGTEGRGAVAHLGMHVVAEWRGRGVGSALMREAIAWARSRDYFKIFLHVWPHNEAAIALYEKFGFEREGFHPKHFRRRDGSAWDAISMGLLLR